MPQRLSSHLRHAALAPALALLASLFLVACQGSAPPAASMPGDSSAQPAAPDVPPMPQEGLVTSPSDSTPGGADGTAHIPTAGDVPAASTDLPAAPADDGLPSAPMATVPGLTSKSVTPTGAGGGTEHPPTGTSGSGPATSGTGAGNGNGKSSGSSGSGGSDGSVTKDLGDGSGGSGTVSVTANGASASIASYEGVICRDGEQIGIFSVPVVNGKAQVTIEDAPPSDDYHIKLKAYDAQHHQVNANAPDFDNFGPYSIKGEQNANVAVQLSTQ